MFAGNFPPRGWAYCDGQLLAVSANDALFSLLGTIYGGDGRTTFGLPDLRGRLPVHAGSGPGLTPRRLGAKAGAEDVTLTVNQLPSHGHGEGQATTAVGSSTNPSGLLPARSSAGDTYVDDLSTTEMAVTSTSNAGGSDSHNNIQPFLCVHFIIALAGIYPSRD
jgi:microcystin-dependent protein